MKYEEAIEALEMGGGLEIGGKPKRVAMFFEAIELAIEALEKQIPKKHHHTRIDHINDSLRVSVCPNCLGIIYTFKAEYPNFCTQCGQKIDWSDMQEVFEKIKQKLEEKYNRCLKMYDWHGQSALEEAIEIVDQVAEEYEDNM